MNLFTNYPYLADSMKYMNQHTETLAMFNRGFAAEKTFWKNMEEQAREKNLADMYRQLETQPILPLRYGPNSASLALPHHLPESLTCVVEGMAEQTGWDRMAILMATLGTLSIAMWGRYRVKGSHDWLEPVVLYQMIVASSGSKKSDFLKILKQPLTEYLQERQDQHTRQNRNRDFHADVIKQGKSALFKEKAKRILKNSEANCYDFFPELIAEAEIINTEAGKYKPAQNALPRFFSDSLTAKKLIRVMLQQGGGIAFFEAEGNALAHSLKAKGGHLDLFLKGYTMEAYSDETVPHGDLAIQSPFLNMLYIVQPEILNSIYRNQKLLSVGLTPRFLPYFAPPPAPTDGFDRFGPGIQNFHKKIRRMIEKNFTQQKDREIFTLSISLRTQELVQGFKREIFNFLKTGDFSYKAAFLRKLHGTACRLAAAIHAWEHDEPEKHPIAEENFHAAISIARHIEPHADYALSPTGEAAYHSAKKILEWMDRHRQYRFTSRDIGQGVSNMRNENIFPALDLLERHNILRQWTMPGTPRICVAHPQAYHLQKLIE